MGPSVDFERLITRLLETLGAIPGAHADLAQSSRGAEVAINLTVDGRPVRVLVEAKRVLYPRDAREVAWQIRDAGYAGRNQWADHEDIPLIPLLAADSISPGAREFLKEQQIGYFDGSGSLYLPAPGAFLFIDRPPTTAQSRAIRSLFTGTRGQVIHALLHHHREWVTGKHLASEAQVSSATASQVLTELERLDWVSSQGQGPRKQRRLKQPGTVLDSWVKQLSALAQPAPSRYFVPSRTTDGLIHDMDDVFGRTSLLYAVSFEAAAQQYAPFASSVSQVRCRLQPDPRAAEALADLDARPVTEGANLIVIDARASGAFLFRERPSGVWLASPIQVYLDLMRSEGRAREMADYLRKERMGF
jgi:hypothetical protein